MQKFNLYFTIFQKISERLTILLTFNQKRKQVDHLKVSDLQLASHPTFQTLLFLHLPNF